MFTWLARCWGGVGVTTQFEKARLACTHPDWLASDSQSLDVIIKTFMEEDSQTKAIAAFNSFFVHFQQDQQCLNSAFILKNLFILDLVVESRIFLRKISEYENGRLLLMKQNDLQFSSVKQLISTYFHYIKQKAKLYLNQDTNIIQRSTRKQSINKLSIDNLRSQVRICMNVQNLILKIDDKYTTGNKSNELIHQVFYSLLKTYIFCHSIVAIVVTTFTKNLLNLNKLQVADFYKLAILFNKQYTRNFLLFIEHNKTIPGFKQIKYNQMIIIDDRILDSIDKQLNFLNQKSDQTSKLLQLPYKPEQIMTIEHTKQAQIASEDNSHKQNRQHKQFKRRIPKKQIDLSNSALKTHEKQYTAFEEYQNFYSQMYVTDYSGISTSNYRAQDDQTHNTRKKSQSVYLSPVINQLTLDLGQNYKFNKETWQSWQNVYYT